MKEFIAFALTTACVVLIEEVRCSTEICYPIPRVVEKQKGQGEPGRPGKRGPAGPQGVKGESGSCVCATEEFKSLRSQLQTVQEQVTRLNEQHAHVDLDAHCFAGLKNGDIPDTAITASSVWNNNDARHRPRFVRLDLRAEYTNSAGAWISGNRVAGEWIQVDFSRPRHLTGVVTQGRGQVAAPIHGEWVTSFRIAFSDNGTRFHNIENARGTDQVFQGNFDQNTYKINMFPQPITARYVRLVALTWHNNISVRMEYLIC